MERQRAAPKNSLPLSFVQCRFSFPHHSRSGLLLTQKELTLRFAGNISAWDVSNLEDSSFMFRGAIRFNSNISNWNVAKVTVMTSMFQVRRDLFSLLLSEASLCSPAWTVWPVSISRLLTMKRGSFSHFFTNITQDAEQFDQNLCAWGPRLLAHRNNVVWTGVFAGSNCNMTAAPVDALSGPWCQACNGKIEMIAGPDLLPTPN